MDEREGEAGESKGEVGERVRERREILHHMKYKNALK